MIESSIVVPAFNAAAALPGCLGALAHQAIARERYEVIVVDDGSGDDSAEVAEQLGARVLRVGHAGPAAARNRGVAAARGELVLFTDADCEPGPDWIEQITRPFGDPRVAGVMGAYRTRQTGLVARFAQVEFEDRYARMSRRESIDLIATYSAAYRREALLELDGFDAQYPEANNEDVELAYRASRAGYRLVFNPRAYVFHTHPDSLRRYLAAKLRRGYWRTQVYHQHPDKALRDSYTPQSLKLQIGLAGLTLLLFPTALILPPLAYALVVVLIAFIASATPFARFAWAQDWGVGAVAIPMLFARSIVFGCGVVWGVLRRRTQAAGVAPLRDVTGRR